MTKSKGIPKSSVEAVEQRAAERKFTEKPVITRKQKFMRGRSQITVYMTDPVKAALESYLNRPELGGINMSPFIVRLVIEHLEKHGITIKE